MKNKKRKILWNRVILLVILVFIIIISCFIGIKFILNKQKENRDKINVNVIYNGYPIDLTADQFVKFKTNKLDLNTLIEIPEIDKIDVKEEPKLIDLGEFRITAYCNCEICCGQWAWGPTYCGTMPEQGRTIAVDTDIIPIGTHVIIDGNEYIAEDTGSAIIGNRIDIYVEEHDNCFAEWCNGYKHVYIQGE